MMTFALCMIFLMLLVFLPPITSALEKIGEELLTLRRIAEQNQRTNRRGKYEEGKEAGSRP